MVKQPERRPGRHRIDDVQDPTDPKGARKVYAWFSIDHEKKLMERHPWVCCNVVTAIEVLEKPRLIYRGTRTDARGKKRSGWCYVGTPKTLRNEDMTQYPFPRGKIFLAFLDLEYNLYEWRPEEADKTDRLKPHDAEGRFGALAWKAK